ncbi:MAG: right-handed parallel beta-helix repeat-containing protein [Acidobacteria bacterium]|nr:right-handed parallel beta-helix repeat-containing protein [Acidobacteriota bacterium]MCW5971448.1 right-handed parallel beta-helix repeat-containing protein [Blastocatellales bacterium]
MKQHRNIPLSIRLFLTALLAFAVVGWAHLWDQASVMANHTVFVEGEEDFDGDGRVGLEEDTDAPVDGVFGTLTAALAAANGGANQNGRVTIVTSGRFRESLLVTAANGNVVIEAAPGVDAIIEAVIPDAGRSSQFPNTTNATAQALPAIVVNGAANRVVVLRNLTIRNWLTGIQVNGASRVTIDNCRLDSNVNFGVDVTDSARVNISNSQVNGTGFRSGATGSFPTATNIPLPGTGVSFRGASRGAVYMSTITSSFAIGLANFTGATNNVTAQSVNLFDNAVDVEGVRIVQ